MRLKHLCTDSGQYGLNLSADAYVSEGIRLIRTSDIQLSGLTSEDEGIFVAGPVETRYRLQFNDLLLSRAGTIGRAFLAPREAEGMAFAGFLVRFRPLPLVEPRFLSYVTQGTDFQQAVQRDAVSNTISNFNAERYANLPIPFPPIEAQRAIADFLDRETDQIDAMIEAQRRLVDRLDERQRAVSAAVLDSGLSDVKLGRLLKHHIRDVRQGWSPQCHPYPRSDDTEWAVLRTGCVNGGRFNPEDNKTLPDDLAPRPDTVVRRGEIVMSRANTRELLGSAAVVASDHQRLMLSDKLYALDVLPHANPWFIAGLLGTRHLRDLIEIAATGASQSMQNISQYDIVNLPMELPARDVQDEAVEQLALAQRRIGDLVSAATDAIALMQERRAALISAAVTGRLDPRTGKESTPEQVLESV